MDGIEMVTATRYDPKTGQLGSIRNGQIADITAEGLPFALGEFDRDTQYVDVVAKQIKPRPEMLISQNASTITANTAQILTLGGLPLNCYVSIGAHRYFVDDGILEWSTPMTGAFPITVECFPFLDWHSEVTVIANN